jgi:hypothetical protein
MKKIETHLVSFASVKMSYTLEESEEQMLSCLLQKLISRITKKEKINRVKFRDLGKYTLVP